ncbi:MAG: flagellar hook-basal body complex protein FliE [Deltaproteobacteria bacterium]|nr:flagellar hook-basal body complex protein FliE [Deltaproteobacteria bacterium]
MKDIFSIGGLTDPAGQLQKVKQPFRQEKSGNSFGNVLKDAVNEVSQMQVQADQSVTKMQVQESGSLHEVMIALEKADISFRTMLQVRNKALEAYQEIMRMSV